jgi:hypothetical protein
MKLTNQEKEKILRIVNNPQLTFEETKQELTIILPSANEQQIETLTKIICQDIDQKKRGQFTKIFDSKDD